MPPFRSLALFGLLALPLSAQSPVCADLEGYVYRVELRHSGAVGFGGGFFISAEGEFVTAFHLFQQSARAGAAMVAVDEGSYVFNRPITAITSYSRDLDYVTARVRLDGARVRVPPIGPRVMIGEKLFGFTVQVPGPVGPQAGLYARAGLLCAEGRVSGVSPRQINASGKNFFGPGSSGTPVFGASGGVVALAMEMINPSRLSRRPEYIYVSLPVERALKGRRLARPMAFAEFMDQFRGSNSAAQTRKPR